MTRSSPRWLTLALALSCQPACRTTNASRSQEAPKVGASPNAPAANVLPVTVDGRLCLDRRYTNSNEPCVSVTICMPGTQTCQTIDGVLLDTGSSGLRLFASVVHLPLPKVLAGGGTLAGCASFSGPKSTWGPIANADLVLGGEPAVNTSVFLVDKNYAKPTGPCDPNSSDLDSSPEDSGFNGILGVSHQPQDCGKDCETNPDNDQYFSCVGSDCHSTATNAQLVNPIGLLPVDNNGVILTLPAPPKGGAPTVEGTLVLGIGTQPNNQPAANIKVFDTRDFATTFPEFGPQPITSGSIDSGSSKIYLPKIPSLPVCDPDPKVQDADQTGPVCPTPPKTITATMTSRGVSNTVTFELSGAAEAEGRSNDVFADYASAVSPKDPQFMWGLPFFLGRSVYVGFEGKASSLGTGPYWAY